MIEQICQQCGEIFLARPYKVNAGDAKFCSRECHYKHMTTRVRCICQHCGEVFDVHLADITRGRGQFCSRLCSAQHRVGIPLSQETKRRISESNSVKTRPKELRQRISATLKAKYTNGYIHPMLGKQHTEESRIKMSLSQKGKHQHSEEWKTLTSGFMKKKWQDLDYRQEILKILAENQKTVSERMRRLWQDPQYRQEHIEKLKQYYSNPEVKKQKSRKSRDNWQNPDYVSTIMRARGIKPTKPERQLIDILSRYFPEFEYNGDGRLGVTLGGLIPDFINVNGKKDLIEVFGDYYHSPEVIGDDWRRSELGKIMIYNSLGWKCLVIWQHELKELSEQQIVHKIKTFFREKAHSKNKG